MAGSVENKRQTEFRTGQAITDHAKSPKLAVFVPISLFACAKTCSGAGLGAGNELAAPRACNPPRPWVYHYPVKEA